MLWVLVGKGIEKDAVDDAKDGRVRADAESEGDYSDGCEGGILEEHAHGVMQILPKRFNRHESPHFPAPLLQTRCIPKLTARGVMGFLSNHSSTPVLFFSHRHVKGDFVIEIAI